MGFYDVVFLPSQASFSATFQKNCVRGESLVTITCLKTVVGISWRSYDCHNSEVNLAILSFRILLNLRQWCLSR